jgi:putative tricarboxylic transport membrane protein
MEREAPAPKSPPREATEQTGVPGDGAAATEESRRRERFDRPPSEEGAVSTARDEAAQPEGDEPKVEVVERESSPRGLLAEIVPELVLLVIVAYLFYLAGDFKGQAEPGQPGPAFWPRMAAGGMAIALVVSIFQTVRAHGRPIVEVRSEFEGQEEDTTAEAPIDRKRAALAMALVVAYVIATMFLGFLIATAVFLTTFIWLGGQRRWYVPLVAGAGALGCTSVFIGIVYVDLPTGVGVFDSLTVAIYRLLGLE